MCLQSHICDLSYLLFIHYLKMAPKVAFFQGPLLVFELAFYPDKIHYRDTGRRAESIRNTGSKVW
jgi:hypothetical protein